jgi:hypothetical protein
MGFLNLPTHRWLTRKPEEYTWPKIVLGDDENEPGYVHPDNIKLLLDGTEKALQSQIEGVRQMFSRLGTVLTQASTLASLSAGGVFWLAMHPAPDRPSWVLLSLFFATICWTVSGGLAVIGMIGAKFAAPGLNPEDGLTQNVLSQSVRDMRIWAIETNAGSIQAGRLASDKLRSCLNAAVVTLVGAPLVSLGLAFLISIA